MKTRGRKMELARKHWNKDGVLELENYLLSLSKGTEKGMWEQRITGTKLPCIAVPSTEVRKIVSGISKGNFLELINLWPWQNLTMAFIVGELISKIKDFNVMKPYLLKYAQKADSWAITDTIKFKPKNKTEVFEFAKFLTTQKETFVRRQGVILMLKILDKDIAPQVLDYLNFFENEPEFYVNMAVAWVICECFIKNREATIKFLDKTTLKKEIINKAISKMRDSYRVAGEDKQMILKYKK